MRWALGDLALPAAADGAAGAPPKAAATADAAGGSRAKPEIVHQRRPAERTAPAPAALLFAGVAALPLLAALAYAARAGNLRAFPAGAASLWALALHGGIAAMLALYAAFWVRLNLAQTLPAALALGAATAAVGYKALSAVADARLAREAKKQD